MRITKLRKSFALAPHETAAYFFLNSQKLSERKKALSQYQINKQIYFKGLNENHVIR
jgi:hypothetical protein